MWLAAFGSSCFKITDQKGIAVGADIIDAEPTLNKMCAQEGTRLATFKTSAEKIALLAWAFSSEYTPTSADISVRCVYVCYIIKTL